MAWQVPDKSTRKRTPWRVWAGLAVAISGWFATILPWPAPVACGLLALWLAVRARRDLIADPERLSGGMLNLTTMMLSGLLVIGGVGLAVRAIAG